MFEFTLAEKRPDYIKCFRNYANTIRPLPSQSVSLVMWKLVPVMLNDNDDDDDDDDDNNNNDNNDENSSAFKLPLKP